MAPTWQVATGAQDLRIARRAALGPLGVMPDCRQTEMTGRVGRYVDRRERSLRGQDQQVGRLPSSMR
jgi:hypothetical protein